MIKDFYTIVGMLFLAALGSCLVWYIGYLIIGQYEKRKQRKDKEKEDAEYKKYLHDLSDLSLGTIDGLAKRNPKWGSKERQKMIEEELRRRIIQKQN